MELHAAEVTTSNTWMLSGGGGGGIICTPTSCPSKSFILLSHSSSQGHNDIGTSTRQSHLHGVTFPIQPEAITAIGALTRKELAYVQLVMYLKTV